MFLCKSQRFRDIKVTTNDGIDSTESFGTIRDIRGKKSLSLSHEIFALTQPSLFIIRSP